MGNSKSKPTLLSHGFQRFPELPVELQSQIWTHAAVDWAIDRLIYMTSPTHSDKTVFMLHIAAVRRPCTCTSKHSCWLRPKDGGAHDMLRFELPPMLVVGNLPRAVMYDTLLSICRPGETVARGGDACVYILEAVQAKNEYGTPKYYGLRIQDMRPPGLVKRMNEEKERLAEMQAELTELVELGLKNRFTGLDSWDDNAAVENVVFRRKKPEGWFRLPLGYDVAYYKVKQGGCWVNKHIK